MLTTISSKFNIDAKRLFTCQGGEIDDVKLVRDDDILYVSSGEDFIKPSSQGLKGDIAKWDYHICFVRVNNFMIFIRFLGFHRNQVTLIRMTGSCLMLVVKHFVPPEVLW